MMMIDVLTIIPTIGLPEDEIAKYAAVTCVKKYTITTLSSLPWYKFSLDNAFRMAKSAVIIFRTTQQWYKMNSTSTRAKHCGWEARGRVKDKPVRRDLICRFCNNPSTHIGMDDQNTGISKIPEKKLYVKEINSRE